MQPYSDTPLDHENTGENVYMNIINSAQKYVYIFTPYLIIDHEMLVSLQNAAKRGVDVRIVTPGIPDKKFVYLLTQADYGVLIESGVRRENRKAVIDKIAACVILQSYLDYIANNNAGEQ